MLAKWKLSEAGILNVGSHLDVLELGRWVTTGFTLVCFLAHHYRGWQAPLPLAQCVPALPASCQNTGGQKLSCYSDF